MTSPEIPPPAFLNVGCGPHRAPAPWLNLDVIENDEIRPDVIVSARYPLADFRREGVARVYLGHVLEHVPWGEVDDFLRDVWRVLEPGGEALVVGPDVWRAVQFYGNGNPCAPWEIVHACLEGDGVQLGTEADDAGDIWPGARHEWNCHEARVVRAGTAAGFGAVPLTMSAPELDAWPVVSRVEWQCAVLLTKPGA